MAVVLKLDYVRGLRRLAARGTYDGTPRTWPYAERCIAVHRGIEFWTKLMFTRDDGLHSSGWWKNPDYERCCHLSLSFFHAIAQEPAPQQSALAREWCELFFGNDCRLLWVEPPYSDHGRRADVYHYRLFCDPAWKPILPRGEVYTREFTERGWKSFSDVHNAHLVEMEGER